MNHAATALAAMLMLASASAGANLTARQEGRLAASQCWAQCEAAYMDGTDASNRHDDDWTWFTASADYFDLTEASQDAMWERYAYRRCIDARVLLVKAQGCSESCKDVESVYRAGGAAARTRARFATHLRQHRDFTDSVCADIDGASAEVPNAAPAVRLAD